MSYNHGCAISDQTLTTTNINDVTSLSPKIWPTKSGSYLLVSTTKERCSAWDSVYIEVQDPVADFTISGSGNTKTFDKSASTNYDSSKYDFGGAPGNSGKDSFEFTKNGSYTICLTVSTTEGCKSENCKKIEITTVGFQTLSNSGNRVLVYPNPTANKFKIKMENGTVNSIQIFDLQGKSIYSSSAQEEYDISNLPEGNYVLEIRSEKELIRMPLIKSVK